MEQFERQTVIDGSHLFKQASFSGTNEGETTMKIRNLRMLLAGLLLSGLTATLLIQPAHSVPTAQQAAPKPSTNYVLPYRGVWVGTYTNVGSQGQVQMYIDPSGQLYGSLQSKEGEHFAQISGYHRGNVFHMVFTPPPGAINQFGNPTPIEVDATAQWDGSPSRFVIHSMTRTGHSQNYTFERLKPG